MKTSTNFQCYLHVKSDVASICYRLRTKVLEDGNPILPQCGEIMWLLREVWIKDSDLWPLCSCSVFTQDSTHCCRFKKASCQGTKNYLGPLPPPPPKKKFIVNSANYYIFMNVLSSVDDWQVLPYSPCDWQSADTGGRSQCQSLSAGRGCHWYWQQESEGVLYTSKWATSDYTIVHCKNVRPSCYGQLIINVTVLCYFHNELIISFSQLHSHVAKITICRIYIQFRCKNFLKLQNEKGYIITLTHWVCGKYFVIERYTSHTFITIQYQKWFKDWRKNIVFCHWKFCWILIKQIQLLYFRWNMENSCWCYINTQAVTLATTEFWWLGAGATASHSELIWIVLHLR